MVEGILAKSKKRLPDAGADVHEGFESFIDYTHKGIASNLRVLEQ